MQHENALERPNRVVTCHVCGVQMPQRYLERHLQGHAQGAQPTEVPENESVQAGTPDPQALNETAHDRQSSGSLVCPACAVFIAEVEFSSHMQAQHNNWCPLCLSQTKDLAGHLSSYHRLKPVKTDVPYERNWKAQKRFICLGCKKKVSVFSYPKHEGHYSPTRGPAQPG
jgi:hypothetical protein